jgi:hypothetical protein
VRIERLQVEEGFLDGLDVRFAPGLNVIIGARGTGKTSIIELIRFCLSAPAFTADALRRGNQQASAVLQGGIVTVTVSGRDGAYTVSRSADGPVTSTAIEPVSCTVLAQNEVEAVGAELAGRLHLIDRFRPDKDALAHRVEGTAAQLRSTTAEIRGVVDEGVQLREQIGEFDSIGDELADATATQQGLLDEAKASAEDQTLLSRLQGASAILAAREAIYSRSENSVGAFLSALRNLEGQPAFLLEEWLSEAGPEDLLADLRTTLRDVEMLLKQAATKTESAFTRFIELRNIDVGRRGQIESETRQLRQNLEQVQTGISVASRRVAELQERQGQLNALNAILKDRRQKFLRLIDQRSTTYTELEDLRDHIYEGRQAVAERLTKELGPAIRVRVTRSQSKDDYLSAIVAGLRGSGLHYNTLAPALASKVSPYELVTWVEQGNASDLATAVSLSPDRAQAVIGALRSGSTPEIIASRIDDGVTLELLDGKDYKETNRLSIGQRCTVVLPLLLSRHGDPLLVDQPEDHLDNAFIATTLVNALRRREATDQIIFTSHNANIPVLGDADNVIAMESDGERGYVASAGSLEDTRIVAAVSNVMEGGAEAFAKRASFYGRASG